MTIAFLGNVVNVAANGWPPAHEVLVAACGIAASVALVLAFLPPRRLSTLRPRAKRRAA